MFKFVLKHNKHKPKKYAYHKYIAPEFSEIEHTCTSCAEQETGPSPLSSGDRNHYPNF